MTAATDASSQKSWIADEFRERRGVVADDELDARRAVPALGVAELGGEHDALGGLARGNVGGVVGERDADDVGRGADALDAFPHEARAVVAVDERTEFEEPERVEQEEQRGAGEKRDERIFHKKA